MSRLSLFLLGPPRLERDGIPVPVRRRKAMAVLSYLAMTGQSHARDALATLLWPEYDQSDARADLRRALATLREALRRGKGCWKPNGRRWVCAPRPALRQAQSLPRVQRSGRSWLDVDALSPAPAQPARTHGHAPQERPARPCISPLLDGGRSPVPEWFPRPAFHCPTAPSSTIGSSLRAEGSARRSWQERWSGWCMGSAAQGELEAAIPYARRWVGARSSCTSRHTVPADGAICPGSGSAQPPCASTPSASGSCEQELRSASAGGDRPPVPGDPGGRELPSDPGACQDCRKAAGRRSTTCRRSSSPLWAARRPLAEIGARLQDPDLPPADPGRPRRQRQDTAGARSGGAPRGALPSWRLFRPAGIAGLGPRASSRPLPQASACPSTEAVSPLEQLLDYLRLKSVLLVLDNMEHLLASSEPRPEPQGEPEHRNGSSLVGEILARRPRRQGAGHFAQRAERAGRADSTLWAGWSSHPPNWSLHQPSQDR